MSFDDVNLNDDKGAPKLDLDFGGGGTTDNKSNGFSFGGGWGSGWGGGGSGWGATDPPAEGGQDDGIDNAWSFGTTAAKKDKKKKGGSAFDFGFDDAGGAGDQNMGDLASPPAEEKAPEQDPWAGFGKNKNSPHSLIAHSKMLTHIYRNVSERQEEG